MTHPTATATATATVTVTEGLVRLGVTPAPAQAAAVAPGEQPMGSQASHPAAGLPAGGAIELPAGGAIELLRLQVPAAHRQIWLQAECAVWEPWLLRQPGFLGRELFWDPALELGVLLIRWASRQRWHAIPAAEVSQVHQAFQLHARELLRHAGHRSDEPHAESPSASADCFPLLSSGEVHVEPPLTPPG